MFVNGIAPLFESKIPMLFYEFHCSRFVFISVFLVALFLVEVGRNICFCLFKSGNIQCLIDFLRHFHGIAFEILKLDFNQIAFRNQRLFFLIPVVQAATE